MPVTVSRVRILLIIIKNHKEFTFRPTISMFKIVVKNPPLERQAQPGDLQTGEPEKSSLELWYNTAYSGLSVSHTSHLSIKKEHTSLEAHD